MTTSRSSNDAAPTARPNVLATARGLSADAAFRLRKHADYQVVYAASRKQHGKQMSYFFRLRCIRVEEQLSGAKAPTNPELVVPGLKSRPIFKASVSAVSKAPRNSELFVSGLESRPIFETRSSADSGKPRIGLTVPKALGGAVDRNRIKRRMRECIRRHRGLLTSPVDVILHPRRSVIDLDFAVLDREVATVFRAIQKMVERQAVPQRTAQQASRTAGE